MKDYQTSVEHLRKQAAENLNSLADDVEHAMAAKVIEEDR
jgi:hypothetical protein